MKKINKKILILIISIISVLSLSIGVFAYFNMTKNQIVDANTKIDTEEEQVIEIASFADLFTYSKSSTYNDKNIVSNPNTRKILKLTSDIDLPTDLEITADIHLNLNGKKLNLNDHTLTLRHGYAGCYNMYGGEIATGENGSGNIILDIPNSTIVTNSMTYKHGDEAINESDCITILNIDPKYTSYMALLYVSNGIASDLNKKTKIENYNTVKDDSFELTNDKFITSKNCIVNSNSSDICSFVYKDLDLPFNYLSEDISITYSSSDESTITNEGFFTVPSTSKDVTLTATIESELWDDSYECDFKLHAINLNNETVKNNVAEQLIKDYLEEYYIEDSLKVTQDITISNYYGFNQGIQLPINALGGNITYSYTMTDYTENPVNTTSHINNNSYVLEPNDKCYHLVINMNESKELKLNMYSTYVGDYETIARLILNRLYGGSIIFDSTQDKRVLYDLSSMNEELESIDSDFYNFISSYNITGLEYKIKEDSEAEDYYDYSNYKLTLKNASNTPVKTSYVTVTFTFGSGSDAVDVDVDLYVDFLAESGDTLAGFLPYYNMYDPMVFDELTSSFEMPFSYGTAVPYVCYDFATTFDKLEATEVISGESQKFNYYDMTLSKSSGLKVILYYNGAERLTFTNYGETPTSFTNQLDSHLTSVGKTLEDIANYGDAKYIFKIDAQNATVDNIKTLLIYNYKFNKTGSWVRYEYNVNNNTYLTELTTSIFTVSGGLFYNSSSTKNNAIQDVNFFKWIYNNFNPDEDAKGLTTVTSDSFIPKNWLSLDVALDVDEDSTLNSVTNFYGVGNLKSVTKVNLSGKTINSTVLSSIATMESVASLKLKGCSITDITNICNMKSVKMLDVSENSINDFNGLVNMKNLEEVYVYSNNATTDNPIVGSLGITNFQAYNDLIRKGIAVFNQISEGVPVIYTDSDDYNDYAKLKSIIYQDKLSKEVSITKLYDNFKGRDFSLQNTDGEFTWGYQTTDNDGNTYTEYTATYFYVNYVFSGYTLIVKYYVDRY